MRATVRLKTLLGVVLGAALVFAAYVSFVHSTPWERAGGMIGWNQAAIESQLGAPTETVEHDVPDPHAQKIRPRPSGTYRTVVFNRLDGRFMVWLRAEADDWVCFQSSWVEKGRYY